MSERYSKLFSLPENLYAAGSPVIIAAGALLKDNQTGKVLAQIKLRSISSKGIKAVSVSIQPLDTTGKPLGDAIIHQYLDLTASRDTEFAQKSPVALPDNASRGFSVVVTQVIFADNSLWDGAEEPWTVLPDATSLKSAVRDAELAKQYKLELGHDKDYVYTEAKDLWYCACGALNHEEEAACHRCREEAAQLRDLDWDGLKEKKNQRLAEAKVNEDAARAAAAAKQDATQKLMKKIGKIVAVVAAVAVVVLSVFLVVTEVIIPGNQYKAALALVENGQYEEAIDAFEALGDYKDSTSKVLDARYSNAVALMDSGNTIEAYEALTALDGYKDSTEKAISIFDQYLEEKNGQITVGKYITFGAYEQDNNTSNGKEDIEWLVLDIKDGKALVISKYALDFQPYNTKWTDVTWETCTLRTWLNSTFLNGAFSATERAMIPTVTVSADKNPDYNTNPGNATQDKVFLLSITEVNKYFGSDSASACKLTAYADAQGVWADDDNGNCEWWLRSPGKHQDYAAFVHGDGGVYELGYDVGGGIPTVRPALWITIE